MFKNWLNIHSYIIIEKLYLSLGWNLRLVGRKYRFKVMTQGFAPLFFGHSKFAKPFKRLLR